MNIKDWLGEDNQLGTDIVENKYIYNNESFDELLDRVSGGDEAFREEIKAKRFLPGGRIIANRGLYKDGIKTTYSNCYVLPQPEDNIESIYDTAGKLARTFSYGGGVGIDISKLAPRGAKVNNTAKETSGAVSFMDLFSLTTGLIGQNGRRGALMLSIDCNHPDLEEFIEIKSDLDRITKANISIRITDEFMEAVENNADYELSFIRDETGEKITKTVNAKEIFDKLAKMNWDMAEPGMLYWDTINHWNLMSNNQEFKYAGVNPCAEEPLPAGGSCLLGSINLSEFVIKPYTDNAKFNFEQFINTIKIAVKALNDVLDEGLPLHPLAIQRETVRDWRQIGLGVFGIADMLIKFGLKYGDEQSLDLCSEIARCLAYQAISTSCDLAKTQGSFPKCNNEKLIENDFFKYVVGDDDAIISKVKKYGLRNSQLLTIAPTGTLSTMLKCSGGIEPYFAKSWTRKTESLHGKEVYYTERPKAIQELMDAKGLKNDDELPDYVITSGELDPMARIAMQGVWQTFIDASISSTINLPNSATVEDVKKIYIEAWKYCLKGVTIYRDGCKRSGILTTSSDEENTEDNLSIEKNSLPRGVILEADNDAIGKKRKLITGCGSLHCSAFFDPITGDLLETYLSKGSTGGCNNFMIGLSRMMSLAARSGTPIEEIIDQLSSCGTCPSYAVRRATQKDTSIGSCCPVAVGNALKDMYDEMQSELFSEPEMMSIDQDKPSEDITESLDENNLCPQCGEPMSNTGGCATCISCGYSPCG